MTTIADALKRRGSLAIWFDPDKVWAAKPTAKRGRQPVQSDLVIQTCLTMKALLGLTLTAMLRSGQRCTSMVAATGYPRRTLSRLAKRQVNVIFRT